MSGVPWINLPLVIPLPQIWNFPVPESPQLLQPTSFGWPPLVAMRSYGVGSEHTSCLKPPMLNFTKHICIICFVFFETNMGLPTVVLTCFDTYWIQGSTPPECAVLQRPPQSLTVALPKSRLELAPRQTSKRWRPGEASRYDTIQAIGGPRQIHDSGLLRVPLFDAKPPPIELYVTSTIFACMFADSICGVSHYSLTTHTKTPWTPEIWHVVLMMSQRVFRQPNQFFTHWVATPNNGKLMVLNPNRRVL